MPEYIDYKLKNSYPPAYEYTSANTKQLTKYEEISALLDKVGNTELYT